MAIIQITYRRYLKTLLILHLGMMMAQLIFIAIIFVLVNEESSVIDIKTQNILLIGIPAAVMLIIVTGRFFYQQRLKKIIAKKEMNLKFKSYQSLQIIQFTSSSLTGSD